MVTRNITEQCSSCSGKIVCDDITGEQACSGCGIVISSTRMTNHVSEMEGKELTSSSHMPVFSTNKMIIGSPQVESDIEMIYSSYFNELGLDENQRNEVLRIISSVRITDEDNAKEETMKVIRRFCTKNNIPSELSNALGIQAIKILKVMRTKVNRNIGEFLVEKDERKKLRKAFKILASVCDSLSLTQYEAGCMLMRNDS